MVDLPEPVGPVTSTKPRGRLASHSATVRQVEFGEARDLGRDHPQRQGGLAPLGEGAATEPGPVQPGEGEVDVLLDVEGGLLGRVQQRCARGVDLLAGEHRGPFDRAQLAVDADPGCRVSGQEEVRALLVPQDLEPRRDRRDVDVVHWIASFTRRMDAEEPGPRAGLFGSSCRLLLLLLSLLNWMQPGAGRAVVVGRRTTARVLRPPRLPLQLGWRPGPPR